MKKLLLLVLFPCILSAQYVLDPSTKVSFEVKAKTLNKDAKDGVWISRGGYDVNKNGKKEFFVYVDSTFYMSDPAYNTLYLFENDGLDKYKLIWQFKVPFGVNSYGDVQVADVDKDGLQEIWLNVPSGVSETVPNPPRLYCFEFDGTEIPTTPTATWGWDIDDKLDYRGTALVIDDVDGDGDIELITASRKDDYTGIGVGRTLIVGSLVTPTIGKNDLVVFHRELLDSNAYLKGGGIYDVKVVDYDGDGKKEIWVMTWNKLTINIYKATGPDKYEHVTTITQAITDSDIGSIFGTHFYDMNKDGKLEGFIAGAKGTYGAIYYIEPTNDVSKLTAANIKPIGYKGINNNPRGAAIGDFNKNGFGEFVFADRNNNKVVRMEYKGTGNLVDSISYNWTTIFQDTLTKFKGDYYSLTGCSSDMDGDGYTELLLSAISTKDTSKALVIVLEGTGKNSVERTIDEVPQFYRLEQNYPNPFNPNTKIEFSIPKAGSVSLKVYNILGQEVMTLLDGYKIAGKYVASFNASKLSSGNYIYELRSGDFVKTMKMTVLK